MAILLVLLFHLNANIFPNGYIGVDVFLVITGYLLFRSRLAHPEPQSWADDGRFALKRLRRIMPSMLIIIMLTIAVGAFLLWWQDEKFLGLLADNACFLKANTFLAKEFANYFASDSAFIPLLHLWYLSVTLQVYLLWLIGNRLLQKRSRRFIMISLFTVGLASLLYNYSYPVDMWLIQHGLPAWEQAEPASYYGTLPRLWEVLAGGAALLLPLPARAAQTKSAVLSLVGLAVLVLLGIAGSIPGTELVAECPSSLIAVICTMLIIRYMPESRINVVLGNKPLLWLGSISFSLYLVHMPVIVYGHMWVYGKTGLWWYEVLLIGASVVLARLYLWLVEKRKCPWWLLGVLWVMAIVCSKMTRTTHGFRKYLSEEVKLDMPTYHQWQMYNDEKLLADMPEALVGFHGYYFQGPQVAEVASVPRVLTMGNGKREPNIVLMGDSHADHFYAGMDTLFRQQDWSGVYLTSIVCPFHNREYHSRDDYRWNEKKNKELVKWLAAHPELHYLVIAQWWASRFMRTRTSVNERDLREFLQEMKAIGKEVILIADTPEFDTDPLQHYVKILEYRGTPLGDRSSLSSACTREQHYEKHKIIYPILSKMEQEGLCKVVDPIKILAPGESFYSTRGNTVLMYDDNHMNPGLSIEIALGLLPQFRKIFEDCQCPQSE